jgi:hypothetical protein
MLTQVVVQKTPKPSAAPASRKTMRLGLLLGALLCTSVAANALIILADSAKLSP